MERRLTRCSNCHETFSYLYPLTAQSGDSLIISTSCPYCKTRLRIDLNPYTRRKLASYKSVGSAQEESAIELELPAELPSSSE
jgi:hypothetical protein